MIISHSRQFVFVHIHKSGGTSVEQALDPHLAWNDLILGGSQFGERIQAPYAKKFRLSKHSSLEEIEAVCGSKYVEDYFVFSLVRHPLARLCSIYNFVATTVSNWASTQNITLEEAEQRITPQAIKQKPGLAWRSTRVFLKTKSFSEFIRHEDITDAPGFRSQASMLSRKPGGVPAAAYFRLEDYPLWQTSLTERLGIDLHLPHANRSEHRVIAPDAVTAEDRALIEARFRTDYEAFQYPRAPA